MTAFVARRELLLGLAALPLASRIAGAETYPSRPVRILVATSAGGGTDLVARFIAQWLSERLGNPSLSRTGPVAATTSAPRWRHVRRRTAIPCSWRTRSTPSTMRFIRSSTTTSSPTSRRSRTSWARRCSSRHPSVAAKNAAGLIALAKAGPGKLNLASGGVGSTGHMSAELFQMMAGIKLTHVPYRGEAPALTDLIAGEAQLMVSTTGSALQYAKAGTVRALATTTDNRVAELSEVPPLSKTVPGYRANAWSGLCAPKGTPPAIIALLNREVNLAMADTKIKERSPALAVSRCPGRRRTTAERSRATPRSGARSCTSPARTRIECSCAPRRALVPSSCEVRAGAAAVSRTQVAIMQRGCRDHRRFEFAETNAPDGSAMPGSVADACARVWLAKCMIAIFDIIGVDRTERRPRLLEGRAS